MKLNLPDSVSSLQDVTALRMEIHDYARWFSHNDIKHRTHAKQGTAHPVLSEGALELIRTWSNKRLLNRELLDELTHELEVFERTAPSMTITLAAPATSDVRRTLVGWCRTNITPNILVTFQFNATLLGGMVVRYGSRVHDWSFRRQILAARQRFPEVLRNV